MHALHTAIYTHAHNVSIYVHSWTSAYTLQLYSNKN